MGEALTLPLALEGLGIEGIEMGELGEHGSPGELGQGAGVVGVQGPLSTSPSRGMFRWRRASTESRVWFKVPKPLRATSTTGSCHWAIWSI